jgi:hypothetical protein
VFLPAVGLLTPAPVLTDADFSENKLDGAQRYVFLMGLLVAAG